MVLWTSLFFCNKQVNARNYLKFWGGEKCSEDLQKASYLFSQFFARSRDSLFLLSGRAPVGVVQYGALSVSIVNMDLTTDLYHTIPGLPLVVGQ